MPIESKVTFEFRLREIAERQNPVNFDRELTAEAISLLRESLKGHDKISMHLRGLDQKCMERRLFEASESLDEFGVALDAIFGPKLVHVLDTALEELPNSIATLTGGTSLEDSGIDDPLPSHVRQIHDKAEFILAKLRDDYAPLTEEALAAGVLC